MRSITNTNRSRFATDYRRRGRRLHLSPRRQSHGSRRGKDRIAGMEGSEDCIVCTTGMAACTMVYSDVPQQRRPFDRLPRYLRSKLQGLADTGTHGYPDHLARRRRLQNGSGPRQAEHEDDLLRNAHQPAMQNGRYSLPQRNGQKGRCHADRGQYLRNALSPETAGIGRRPGRSTAPPRVWADTTT